jgi:signal transduction histidine kinase
MTTASIGVRLTAWYLSVLGVAMVLFAGGSWWLSTQSMIHAADANLEARIEGVRAFLENPETHLTVDDLREEFGEYAELTQGEALLEVTDGGGNVLCRPLIPGWSELPRVTNGNRGPADRMIGGFPFRVAAAALETHGQRYDVTVAAPMGPAYAALNRFHEWLVLLLALAIALAGAGGYWVSRRALAPVDQITTAVREITVRSLDRRLALPRADDELRRLAGTFNDVLARLEAAVGDIVRFTAEASHELRTPVSLMRTTAEVTLRHERRPDEYRAALADVASQAQHLSSLIDDLLVLARIDAGLEPASSPATFDVRDRICKAIAELTPAAQARAVSVCTRLPSAPVPVSGDAVSLQRALVVLLDNAIKYSHAGGNVLISLDGGERAPDLEPRAVVTIVDHGIGLDDVEPARLFERFYRGARARTHAPEGTGLGLAIARTMVERQGGSLALAAGPRGRGCEASVSMPAAMQPSA